MEAEGFDVLGLFFEEDGSRDPDRLQVVSKRSREPLGLVLDELREGAVAFQALFAGNP